MQALMWTLRCLVEVIMSDTWRENVQRYVVRPYLAAIAAFIITSVLTAVFAHMISFSLASFVVLIALAMLAPVVIVGIDLERILGLVKSLPITIRYVDERQPGGVYDGKAVFEELETAVKAAKEEILMLVADANLATDNPVRDSRRDAYFKVFAEALEEKSGREQEFRYKRIIQIAAGKQDIPIREVLTETTLKHCRRALQIDADYPRPRDAQRDTSNQAEKWEEVPLSCRRDEGRRGREIGREER